MPSSIRWVEKAFARAEGPARRAHAGQQPRLPAGRRARHRRRARYGVLLGVGILGRLVVFWFLGKALEEPLGVVLDWIQRYQWWIVGAFVALTMAQSFRRASQHAAARRRGRDG